MESIMTVAEADREAEEFQSLDMKLADRVRLSILQRQRKQMARLSSNFFDELDDFLFGNSQQSKLSEDSVNLKAMREFRAKQALFEKYLLGAVFDDTEGNNSTVVGKDSFMSNKGANGTDAGYEKVETDLALDAMKRKAGKIYSPFIKQINSLNGKLNTAYKEPVMEADFLIERTILAFAKAQYSFSVGLEIRLIFMKLFEQHVVLKMEKLYLDIISILTNVENGDFVDRLVSSSSTFDREALPAKPEVTNKKSQSREERRDGNSLEERINLLIDRSCDLVALPPFVEKLIRTKWRTVLFLIALNKTESSVEWQEANHTLSLLLNYFDTDRPATAPDMEGLLGKLRLGFTLIQLEVVEQDELLARLKELLVSQDEASSPKEETRPRVSVSDSSISPAGKKFLSPEDLKEISSLMNDGGSSKVTGNFQSPVANFLARIDKLECPCQIEYKLGDQFVECELSKGFEEPASYQIKSVRRRFSISRSKLGLAICLRDGEVRLAPPQSTEKPGQDTEFQPAAKA